ncbi:Response regulator receiver domain-containing protein [Rhizobiales bacterium GAS188]|nr:Response regulator receiver domain-containing protein [Rhizobiales bacterium GAS188]
MANKLPLIAVVDDEEAICRALKRLIVASHLDVATFPSGQAFLDSLQATRPDCLVLDLHMPGLSGLDVLRALTDAGQRIPAIIITGRDEPASRALCLAAGALAYLPKPLDQAKLLRTIGEAVNDVSGHVE